MGFSDVSLESEELESWSRVTDFAEESTRSWSRDQQDHRGFLQQTASFSVLPTCRFVCEADGADVEALGSPVASDAVTFDGDFEFSSGASSDSDDARGLSVDSQFLFASQIAQLCVHGDLGPRSPRSPEFGVAQAWPRESVSHEAPVPDGMFLATLTSPLSFRGDTVRSTGLRIRKMPTLGVLRIDGVVDTGPAHKWNVDHPHALLTVGSYVLQVNQVQGDAERMASECTQGGTVHLWTCRPEFVRTAIKGGGTLAMKGSP